MPEQTSATAGDGSADLPSLARSAGTGRGLGLLFGTMYFLQGVGEPTEGLIIQPVQSLLKSWHDSPEMITAFAAMLALPWWLKPFYGLLTDFVPLAGFRRKSYLVACSSVAAIGFFALSLFPPREGGHVWLFVLLLLPTLGVAFSDVVVDALMIEEGQLLGITGRLQSVQWGAMWAASIGTGILGGYLSGHQFYQTAFLVCGLVALATLLLSIFMVHEHPRPAPRVDFRTGLQTLLSAFRSPGVLSVCLFLFLWNFNPFSTSVLYLHITEEMGWSEMFYGDLKSLMAVASMLACLCYGFYCRRVPMKVLVHGSIALGILSTLAYWALVDQVSAYLVTFAVGFSYMTATLIQLDLAAQTCPVATAGTVFAMLMALSNVSTSLSAVLGGYWYQHGIALWGNPTSFNVLVGIGSLFMSACWLLVPRLMRDHAI
jgi:MFS family permease